MITKLDRAVARYLIILNAPRPARHDEIAWAVRLDRLDRARYVVLNLLIKRQRYRRLKSRKAWTARNNPHRPPLA
ncbi:hypothetical protein [Geminisphaera colitermitum]|uniref:hypothetical protein n=1 Tax=Geminisphaera colitermitum TaxID=1148786 RepID=UPI000158C72B|nr:hypothetical protein [Geminisphaera colitermitum]